MKNRQSKEQNNTDLQNTDLQNAEAQDQEQQDRARKKKKRRRRIIFWLLFVFLMINLVTIAPYVYDEIKNDPNIVLKKISKSIDEDETVEVTYKYKPGIFGRKSIPLYSFTPEESGAYTFTVSDMKSDEEVVATLEVADSFLNDYLNIDNAEDREDKLEGTVFLSEDTPCYVGIEVISADDKDTYSGSFTLKVSEASEDAKPATITEEEPATIKVREDNQSAVLFIPETEGFFRFGTMVIDDATASSSISAVNSGDNKEVKRSEGICYLEAGKEYYIWISADEMSKGVAKAEVNCKRVATLEADEQGEYSIDEPTIIKYASKENCNLAVYSVSDGNPGCFVYDDNGFRLNLDNNSGKALSGNRKDFALVLQAQNKAHYLIYVDGKLRNCKVVIREYIGDGTSLGPEDIKQEEEAEATEGNEPNEKADEG